MDTTTQFTDHTETKLIVSVEYLRYLEDREMLLNCLEGAGVDNWAGYYYALETYEEISNSENN